jgi:bacillithiol system protein YtxJ
LLHAQAAAREWDAQPVAATNHSGLKLVYSSKQTSMNWIPLSTADDLERLVVLSQQTPQVIFKHSTTCNISAVAKSRLDKGIAPDDTSFYYLDLLSYRSVSNSIAERFGIIHESPQILVIKNGECIYHESHMGIRMDDILDHVYKN